MIDTQVRRAGRTRGAVAAGGETRPLPAFRAAAASPRSGARGSEPGWLRRYVIAVAGTDLCAAILAAITESFLQLQMPAPRSAAMFVAFPLIWLLLVHLSRGYEPGQLGAGSEEFRSLLRAGVLVMAGISVLSFAFDLDVPRGLVLVAVPLVVPLSAVGRYGLRRGLHAMRAQGRYMRTVVAVGREQSVLELVEQVRRESYYGMKIVAACVPDPASSGLLRAAGIRTIADLTSAAATARELDADAVAVTSSSETAASFLRRLSWDLEGTGVELLVAPGLMEVAGPRMHVRSFIGLPLLQVEEPKFTGPQRIVKQALDRLVAAAFIALVCPVLLAVALAVRVDSPGPVLFRQVRIGQGGREFQMLKFRSMVADAEARRAALLDRNQNADGLLFKITDDPRVTRVGRVLRRFSLDELPQLFNVLAGQMSLVGPRPPLPEEVALYDEPVRRRLLVKPGLTGLWQVSGRSDLAWDDAVRLDLRYVENWSLSLDLLILWKTAFAVIRARGAY